MYARVVRSLRNVLVAVALLCATVGARCQTAETPGGSGGTDLERGQYGYMGNCAACHGETGAGDGPLAEPLAVQLGEAPLRLDSQSRVAQLSRDQVREVIVKGGGHVGGSNLMPAWGDDLEPALIDAITDYVMALARSRPSIPEDMIREYFSAPPGSAADGRRLYVYYCSACHGPGGEGDGMVSPTLTAGVPPRNLTNTSFMKEKTDQDLYTAIALGGEHAGLSSSMPGWTYELQPEQIRAVISYIRVLSGTARAD